MKMISIDRMTKKLDMGAFGKYDVYLDGMNISFTAEKVTRTMKLASWIILPIVAAGLAVYYAVFMAFVQPDRAFF